MSEDQTQDIQEDPLTVLKARADLMGVKYHPSISLEKLRDKVAAALAADGGAASEGEAAAVETPQASTGEVVETEGQRKKRKKAEAAALVRIRISCMNPAKKEWDGEIFTAGNSLVGTFSKYVPFNAEEGWHVPKIILEMIQARQCQVFVSDRTARGVTVRKGKLIKEFAVEVLPALTPAELAELARRQAVAQSVD